MLIDKICEICGKQYQVPHWRKESKYCCKECANKAAKAKPNLICPVCGKEFHRKPYHLKRFKGTFGFCCSKKCDSKNRVEHMSGEQNHQYGLKGHLNASFKNSDLVHKNHNVADVYCYAPAHPFADKRGRVLKHRLVVEASSHLYNSEYFTEIDGYKCLKKGLDIHHIDGNHDNNNVSNLAVMTRAQHTSIHNKQKIIIRDSKSGRITAVVKREELLENPVVGNQQPSRPLTKSEGSETNS